jgi:hypothetical protein
MTHHAIHLLGSRMLGFTQDLFDDSPDVDPAVLTAMASALAESHPYVSEMALGVTHDGGLGRLRRRRRIRVRARPDPRRPRSASNPRLIDAYGAASIIVNTTLPASTGYRPAAPSSRAPHQVVEVDLSHPLRMGRDGDDPRRRAGDQPICKQTRQQEWGEMVEGERVLQPDRP